MTLDELERINGAEPGGARKACGVPSCSCGLVWSIPHDVPIIRVIGKCSSGEFCDVPPDVQARTARHVETFSPPLCAILIRALRFVVESECDCTGPMMTMDRGGNWIDDGETCSRCSILADARAAGIEV